MAAAQVDRRHSTIRGISAEPAVTASKSTQAALIGGAVGGTCFIVVVILIVVVAKKRAASAKIASALAESQSTRQSDLISSPATIKYKSIVRVASKNRPYPSSQLAVGLKDNSKLSFQHGAVVFSTSKKRFDPQQHASLNTGDRQELFQTSRHPRAKQKFDLPPGFSLAI